MRPDHRRLEAAVYDATPAQAGAPRQVPGALNNAATPAVPTSWERADAETLRPAPLRRQRQRKVGGVENSQSSHHIGSVHLSRPRKRGARRIDGHTVSAEVIGLLTSASQRFDPDVKGQNNVRSHSSGQSKGR
jgi:hypothetical protein